MRDSEIRLNGTYRMKAEVYFRTVQADGTPHKSTNVTVTRIRVLPGRARRWFFDAAGNAYRSSDFAEIADVIPVEL